MLKDVIKMNKNIVVCRNLAQLDKSAISRNRSMFIDIWPMNFFSGDANSLMDPTSLFLMQLGCILNMVSEHYFWTRERLMNEAMELVFVLQFYPKVSTWKYLVLRVFLCCTATSQESSAGREIELKKMLQILRIKARIVVVPWDNVLAKQLPEGFPEDRSNAIESAPQWELSTIRPEYIAR
jgi:potassium/chloride transporter 9